MGAVIEVSNTLGAGFLERVYERALTAELRSLGISVKTQAPCPVRYKGQSVGDYLADLMEDLLIVELKCADHLCDEHLAQCLNYLRASEKRLCLLVNFQNPKVEWRRVFWGY